MVEYEFLKSIGSWQDVLDDARATVHKESLNKEPSQAFKKQMLIAQHSIIRNLVIRWKWINMPSFCATHFSRHKFEKYISTQRTDRTGVDRSKLTQDAPVSFTGVANAQQLIDAWGKRLCYQADTTTVSYAKSLKKELHHIEPELSEVLVPKCITKCGCDEPQSCGFWKIFLNKHPELTINSTIQERYDVYNRDFFKESQS